MTKQVIIISGMHRSGTSAAARVISGLGFDPGNNLMPADPENPKGYYEDMDIFRLNNKLLAHLFLNWDQVEETEERRIHIYKHQLLDIFSQSACKLLNDKLEASDRVVVKDPRFSILMPFWNSIFNQIEAEFRFYHVIRNPFSVAKSLQKRNIIPIRNGLLLWYYYNIAFLSDLENPVKALFYDELLSHPAEVIKRIWCDTENRGEIPELNIPENIDPALDHYPANDANQETATKFMPQIRALWGFLKNYQNQIFTKNTTLPVEVASPKFTDLYEENATQHFHFNLVLYPADRSQKPEIYRAVTHENYALLPFNLPGKDLLCAHFSVYAGDRRCRIKIIATTIISDNGKTHVTPSGGNFVLQHKDEFYFTDNLPELNFSLGKATAIEKITFEARIFPLEYADLSLIMPALKLALLEKEQAKATVLEKMHLLKSAEKLQQEALNHYKQEIDDYTQQVGEQQKKIELLEKKSLWLFTEFNKQKNSLSWKITSPFRSIHHLAIKIQNWLFIFMNDIGASYRLLRREGVGIFLYRLAWYLRGKRLKEDIENRHTVHQQGIKMIAENLPVSEKIHFEIVDQPLVSIIIPVHNHISLTYQCIKSIRKNTPEFLFEIIVVDDQSSDKILEFETLVGGVKVIRNEQNIGFLKSCNKGAQKANGKYICLLNNDTEVQNGWLEHLVNILENREDAGIAGPKLVYPDGKLQEAGGIVWNDASGWNYGKFDCTDKPEYNYVKEVDYVSGACLLIRKKIWEKLKGFDERFSPAYYEDTDLALRVRELGYKVMYQPAAVVTHFEGQSNGKDQSFGIKKYQEINRKKFFQKWEHKLEVESSPNGENVFFHRDRSLRKKHLLIIDHYVPMYDKDAGSRSTFSYLKLFVKMGFQVHFIGDNFFRHEPYTCTLQQMGIEVLYGSYYQKNIRSWFRENGKYINMVIAHRVHIAPKYFGMIRKFTSAKIAYVGHDLQYLGSRRKFEITGDKSDLKDSKKFEKTEQKIFDAVDIILPFSTYEVPYINKMAPDKMVEPLPVYFFNGAKKQPPGFDERKDILFVGYFGHPPNPDAIKWFVKEIFPLVKKSISGVKLHVVGSKPGRDVMKLAAEDIEITGYVSDEKLLEYYFNCRVSVLPLRFGAGVKGKLLESLFYGLPPVITSIAAEGVPGIEDHALIANRPADFAEKIRVLYTDQNEWEKYQSMGKELINNYYSEDAARKILEKVFGQIMRKGKESAVLV